MVSNYEAIERAGNRESEGIGRAVMRPTRCGKLHRAKCTTHRMVGWVVQSASVPIRRAAQQPHAADLLPLGLSEVMRQHSCRMV